VDLGQRAQQGDILQMRASSVTNKERKASIPVSLVRCFNSSTALKSCAVAVLLLVVMSGMAACHGRLAWHDVAARQASNSCGISEDDADGLNGDLSIDVHAAANYAGTIAQMLKEGKFEQLDCLADRARLNKERFPGGMWKLHELYKGLSEPVQYPLHATEVDWDSLLQRLQNWVAAMPNSVTARVALAGAYIGYAGDARGDGAANTVSEGGWKLFRERTADAKRILEEASALPTKCPEWYVVMQQVAQNQDWKEDEKRALFDRATKFEPGYYYYARVRASNLLPKWGGQPGATEKFTQEIADRIGGDQGDILYFQVASSNYVICACEDDPHLSLARIERGFEASEKQYGVSMLNLNRIAFLTARTRPDDELFASKALTRIGDQWDEETWTVEKDFELAKNYATFMAQRLTIQAAADANMKTPEGLRYQATFEKPYRELARQCVRPEGGDVGRFVALTNVGAQGTVEDIRISGNDPAASCLYEKLRALQQAKTPAFPPPPQAPYWVRLDLDWADFARVASR
jgi:hypothetical protein